jgi:hypothetical protein
MAEKRKSHRRQFIPITRFPLHTWDGKVIAENRRKLPTRRVNDIQVEEISYLDFISRLRLSN